MKNRPFLSRFRFAVTGLQAAWHHEKSFRTQGYFAIGALILLLAVRPSPIWWALISMTIVLVMAAELVNTALEHLADHLHPDEHPKIKLVKDCAAASVLILSIGAIVLAILMLIDTYLPLSTPSGKSIAVWAYGSYV